MLRLVTTTSSPVEATLLAGRLSEAGIPHIRSAGGVRGALGSGRDIYVEEKDLERAREVLAEDEGGFDEAELTRLSEEAGQTAAKDGPTAPSPLADAGVNARQRREEESPGTHNPRGRLSRALERIAGRRREAREPPNPFGR